MQLVPSDTEKLLLSVAGMIARERKGNGVRLNYPESAALLATWVIEEARKGTTVEHLMEEGTRVLTRSDVMSGVPEMMPQLQVEATFPDGRKLVTITEPIK